MLAYAANRRRIAAPRPAPHAMLAIIVAHISLIAAVMSAKMELPQRIFHPPTIVEAIPLPKPPPEQIKKTVPPKTEPSRIDRFPPPVALPLPDRSPVDAIPVPLPSIDAVPDVTSLPKGDPLPKASLIRIGPRFATSPADLRPPYPPSKIASEEEAVLKLRLTIDERGRVIAVDPVGSADPAFLQAARRHLIAKWRYVPASEDGKPIASSTLITLRFELDG